MKFYKHSSLLIAILLTSCQSPTTTEPSNSISTSLSPTTSTSSSSTSIDSSSSSSTSSSHSQTSSETQTMTGIGAELFSFIGNLPSTEGYLPSFMVVDTYKTTKDVTSIDYYQGFVNKANLPTMYFGAQLDQLWTHVGLIQSFTSKVTDALALTSLLMNLYQTYLSSQPQNPYFFQTNLGGFTFTLTGHANELFVQVNVGNIRLTLAVVEVNGIVTYWVDIFISEMNRLIIYSRVQELTIVANAELFGVRIAFLLNITKNNNLINGFSYERYGLESLALRNHLVFSSNEQNFSIAGERGDFILGASPKVNVETYDKFTGAYLGSQVLENIPITGPTYETRWYPMWSIDGWNSIRFEEDNNDDKEFPQVYLNGSSTVFDVHYNTIPFVGTKTSRKYDIELKKSYVFVNNSEGDIEKVLFYYPAFFIQTNELTNGAFGTANSRNGNVFTHTLTNQQLQAIQNFYATLKEQQASFKQVDVDQQITDFLSSINSEL
jgi:hypothetical protein